MASPSNRRARGRSAFYEGGDPRDHNPYYGSYGEVLFRDFLEGWNEAAASLEAEKKREKEQELFCPCCGREYES